MLSEEQRRAYDSAIDGAFLRANQNIASARAHRLTAKQKELIARAESFIAQARETRKVDPATAQSLAQRAELLTREVLNE